MPWMRAEYSLYSNQIVCVGNKFAMKMCLTCTHARTHARTNPSILCMRENFDNFVVVFAFANLIFFCLRPNNYCITLKTINKQINID